MEQSLQDKYNSLWDLANYLSFDENEKPSDMDWANSHELNSIWYVIEGLPAFINKWIEGRFNMNDLLKYTPEYVDKLITDTTKEIEGIYVKYNFQFPEWYEENK